MQHKVLICVNLFCILLCVPIAIGICAAVYFECFVVTFRLAQCDALTLTLSRRAREYFDIRQSLIVTRKSKRFLPLPPPKGDRNLSNSWRKTR